MPDQPESLVAGAFTVRRFDEIDSTQRYVVDEARRGAPAGLVAVAGHQSAGRGRLGRRWEAPAGSNLLMSVLLRPALALGELHLCTVAVALAAADACASAAGLDAQLKWPNDLVVGDRKLAGILAEAAAGSSPGASVEAVVVGLGLNVGWPAPTTREETAREPDPHPDEPDPDEPDADEPNPDEPNPDEPNPDEPNPDETDPAVIAALATSVWRETGTQLELGRMLEAVLVHLAPRLVQLDDARGRRTMSDEYAGRCATLGRRVRVSTATSTVTGTATGVSAEGHLVVDRDGTTTTFAAGDVVHLRLAHDEGAP
ncbi:MAG TPA: biotin--[acetyl-CoA-carboxylase] ligase [Acidimicrobiales bacterium]|nr:biotin--[acetyl-CoA-carboxylase] ligase [Acidimicrobiales bacterium]